MHKIFNCKHKLLIIFLFSFGACLITSFFLVYNKTVDSIDLKLKTQEYSYLPVEAKNYIKKVYEESSEIILTEKNKKSNLPYLNPEYISYLQMSDSEKEKLQVIPTATVLDYSDKLEGISSELPSQYDLRNVNGKNYVSPNRDQGDLNICWAFATAGMVEVNVLKNKDESYNNNSLLISERQLDYATSNNGIINYTNEYAGILNRGLSSGGNFYIFSIAMANGISLFNYNSFKSYDDTDVDAMELSDVLSYNKSLYEMNSSIDLPALALRLSTDNLNDSSKQSREEYLNIVKEGITKYGSAYVSTYMSDSCIYYDGKLNNYVVDVYNCKKENSHAMQIIGWNDNLEYSYCASGSKHSSNVSGCSNVVSGKGVWILKNSWGSAVSNPYLAYDSANSYIHFITELNTNKTWDNNYILGSENEVSTNVNYAMSNTRIRGSERLSKIKFISNSIDSTYYITVKNKNGNTVSFSEHVLYPGLISIDAGSIIIDEDSTIKIEGSGTFVDRLMVFTNNIDKTPYIDLSDYNYKILNNSEFRMYSNTKNIPSGASLVYKLYDERDNIVSGLSYQDNVVAENNVNTLLKFSDSIEKDSYKLRVFYDSNVVGEANIAFSDMNGSGTKSNPFIITNSTQLNQIRYNSDAYYVLNNDIDLSLDTSEGGKYYHLNDDKSDGNGWIPIDGFSGSFDGGGHAIKGLYSKNSGGGLFDNIYDNADIKNLVLDNCLVYLQGDGGALFSKYNTSLSSVKYSPSFSNIILKDSKIYSLNSDNSYNGILFGDIMSNQYSDIKITNIYVDSLFNSVNDSGYLISKIDGASYITIKNIQLIGSYIPSSKITSGILINSINTNGKVAIDEVFSSLYGDDIGSLIYEVKSGEININYVTMVDNDMELVMQNNGSNNIFYDSINKYNLTSQFDNFSSRNSYDQSINFDNVWTIKSVDDISRFPILKFVNFEYTSIPNINLDLDSGKKVNLYDLISPNKDASKRIIYKIDDSSIVDIKDGVFIPKKVGNTKVNIKSLYDGYQRDVLIKVSLPSYTIKFNSNGGSGTMDDLEVLIDNKLNLPINTFKRDNYTFKEWNTKTDGSGVSYSDGSEVMNLASKDKSITLYAIWVKNGSYKINNYLEDIDNNYISKISINTTVEEFTKNIDYSSEYRIEVDYKTIHDKDLLYTGGKTKIYKNDKLEIEYTNVVSGDVNGDGKISYLDYVYVYNHIQKVKHPDLDKKLLTGEYLSAADMSYDGKINYLDYVFIYNKIKELRGGIMQ